MYKCLVVFAYYLPNSKKTDEDFEEFTERRKSKRLDASALWVENLSPAMGQGIDSMNRVWNWVAKLHRLAGRYNNPPANLVPSPHSGTKVTDTECELHVWRSDFAFLYRNIDSLHRTARKSSPYEDFFWAIDWNVKTWKIKRQIFKKKLFIAWMVEKLCVKVLKETSGPPSPSRWVRPL